MDFSADLSASIAKLDHFADQPDLTEIYTNDIQFLSDPVGSGKTEAAIEGILFKGTESHIFVSPTKELGMDIAARMLKQLEGTSVCKNILCINQDTYNRDEYSCCTEHVQKLLCVGDVDKQQVLIITTETLRRVLPMMPQLVKRNYRIYFDEGIDLLLSREAEIGKNTTEFLELVEIGEDGLITVKKGKKDIVKGLAESDPHKLTLKNQHLKDPHLCLIADMLLSDVYDVYGIVGDNTVRCVGVLRYPLFTGFKSVTMIVAMFDQSLLATYWRNKYNVTFTAFNHDLELFDTHKEKGPLMTVWYVLDGRDNASSSTLKTDYDGEPLINHIAGVLKTFFADQEYVYTANKYVKRPRLLFGKGATRMPVVCAGLNSWQEYDNIAALASSLPATWVKNIVVTLLGVSGKDFYKTWRMQSTYQTIGRCSLRDRNSSTPITVVVLSKEEAEAIHDLFPGSTLKGKLGNIPWTKEINPPRKTFRYSSAHNMAYSRLPSPKLCKEKWFRETKYFQDQATRIAFEEAYPA